MNWFERFLATLRKPDSKALIKDRLAEAERGVVNAMCNLEHAKADLAYQQALASKLKAMTARHDKATAKPAAKASKVRALRSAT